MAPAPRGPRNRTRATPAPTTKKVKLLAMVVTPRIGEILKAVKDKISESQKEKLIQSDIVLTGGTAALKDIQYVAEEALEQQVRIGIPKIDDVDSGFHDVLSDPKFSTAVGIIKHSILRKQIETAKNDGLLAKIGDFFRNLFE